MEPSAFDLIPESHRNGYVAMVIGGKHKTKQMPVELSVRLVKEISYPVIILGGLMIQPKALLSKVKQETKFGRHVAS